MNARYHDFKVSERVANKTVEKLQIIKKLCIQPAAVAIKTPKNSEAKTVEANIPSSPAS
jgi:hypothetical protein